MPHPFDDPALQMLKAASEAADTPGRESLLEGLLDGQASLVRDTLEDDHDHGELLDDDFFWCFMGMGLLSGDEEFWKTIGEWGYSLDSEVSFPDRDQDNSWGVREKVPLGVWAMQLLPRQRLEWFEEMGLLQLWKGHGRLGMTLGEKGMILSSPDGFDWLLEGWEREKRNRLSPLSRDMEVPAPLVSMGEILAGMANGKSIRGMPAVEEMERRYDRLARAYLAWRSPHTKIFEQQVAAFSASPASNPARLRGLAGWMVRASPESFGGDWFEDTLKNQAWEWARAAWASGAEGPGSKREPQASDSLFESLLASSSSSVRFKSAMAAIEQWVSLLAADQKRDFVEGSPVAPRTWVALQKGRLDVAGEWIRKGADLEAAHPGTGEKLGTYLLRGVMGAAPEWNSTPSGRKKLWDAIMERSDHEGLVAKWWNSDMNAPLLALAESQQWKLLKDLIEQGASLEPVNGKGMGLTLLEAAVKGRVDGTVWEAYTKRAEEDPCAPSSRFLELTGEDVETSLQESEHVLAELAEWALKHALPQASEPRAPKSRM